MLQILTYPKGFDLLLLRRHFQKLQKMTLLFPGEPIQKQVKNITLLFDDSSFYFYHSIFPLLQEYRLKALLSVPTHYILERTSLSPERRLAVSPSLAWQTGIYENEAPFCTWEEMEEMVRSGYVQVAAHSHLFCNLTFPFVDLKREVIQPKEIIESRLRTKVSTFVYPFGKYTSEVHAYVKQHYSYTFGKSVGYNKSWSNEDRPLQRIFVAEKRDPFSFWQKWMLDW